jgi:DNA repair protein RecO
MNGIERIGYILHTRKYGETSLLVTFFAPEGKLNFIAKGVYQKKGRLISTFQLFIPINVTLQPPRQAEGLYKLIDASTVSIQCHTRLSYTRYISLFYLNELLYFLIPQHAEEQKLYHCYEQIVENSAVASHHSFECQLRHFELTLLDALGNGVSLEFDHNGEKIRADAYYIIKPMTPPIRISGTQKGIQGHLLRSLIEAQNPVQPTVLKLLKKITRLNINHLLNGRVLQSRKFILQYQQKSAMNTQADRNY